MTRGGIPIDFPVKLADFGSFLSFFGSLIPVFS